MMVLQRTRRLLYKAGLRPKESSIWYSPSLAWIYGVADAWKNR